MLNRVRTSSVNGGIDNVATAGEDYVGVSTVVDFQPDVSEETIKITINNDEDGERTEYFLVSLEAVDCGVSGDNRIVITIDDDDESVVRMSTGKITVQEGNTDGVAFVSLERTGSLSKPETVVLKVRPHGTSDAATGESDFDNRDVTAEFQVGKDVVTVEIEIFDDSREEGLESFVVEIYDLSSGSDATIDNDNRETVVCIRDNDGTFRIAGDALERSVSEGTSTQITILRSGDTSSEQTVYLTTNDIDATGNVDYEALSGVAVTFPPGVTSQTVTIDTYDDQELEPRESFGVFLSSDNGNDLGQRALFINIEDEDHEIRFVSVPGSAIIGNIATVSESQGSIILTIQREGYSNNLPAGIATVYVGARELSPTGIPQAGTTPAEQDGSERDFEFTDTTVTFQTGQSTALVEVDIVDDETGENREAFEIYLSSAEP
ncbi:extracellular matrix organizing protein FRAS1-like [Amphiura filiformis]|uniref:extracellular matrix organizing protein FRAS1-like n=1 Tax=Amphiura filiformis TaxID=82378 RepID=UPI003B213659